MPAVRVAQACYDTYRAIRVLPAVLRNDIDGLAADFHSRGEFEGVFIGSLVPWDELVGEPNPGHHAVSDLLVTRAVDATLSANFDTLIEQSAWHRKVSIVGALDGTQAMNFRQDVSPLLKFHGCLVQSRTTTLWTQAQLTDATTAPQIKSCSDWMRLRVPGKDLLVIGFWTDWGYLNDVLNAALTGQKFGSVTVIDPAESTDLQAKAPALWKTLTESTDAFVHVRASSSDALVELQAEFSKVWLRKFYVLGEPLLTALGKPISPIEPDATPEDLYACRCDAEGVPYSRAARTKEPPAQAAQAALCHHLLLQAGAVRDGAWYLHNAKRVRIVQGAGEALNSVRERYGEPPAILAPDVVVCAGSVDLSVPGRVLGSGIGASIVRPAGGGASQWVTFEQARNELKI